MQMENLIEQAESRINEIVEMSKNIPTDHYLAIYEAKDSIDAKIGYKHKNAHTMNNMISFGKRPLTAKSVRRDIDYQKQFI